MKRTAFLMARLNERSTWLQLIPAVAALIGVRMAPEKAEAIATIAAIVVVALASVPDGKVLKRKD
jgi:threonine/homoserine efflux transporter RhtA